MGRPVPRQFMRNALLDLTTIVPATASHRRSYAERYSRFNLADGDRGAVLLVIALDGRFIGRAAIDRDLLRYAMAVDSLGEEALGGALIALLRQEEIDGLA